MTADALPTAGQIARAIVAAAREVESKPGDWPWIALAVANGEQSRGGPNGKFEITRARAYAAMAIRSRFRCGPVTVSRLVAAGSPAVYMTNLSNDVAKNLKAWWSDDVLERVARALGPPSAVPPAIPDARPAAAPVRPAPRPPRPLMLGKRSLLDELRKAVETTAKMTPAPD